MAADYEALHQLVFFAVALFLALLERVRPPPAQRQRIRIALRWTSNIGLFLIGSVAAAAVLPLGLFALATAQPPGVMARAGLPPLLQFAMALLLLDFWRYWEHRVMHCVPLLWRFHLVHHSDTGLDVTTTERHHPFEVLLSTGMLAALVVALGLPVTALAAYVAIASVVALSSHARVGLPPSLDAVLRRLIVTPTVHAVHHSELQQQTDSNYGAVLTIWDRCFDTWLDPSSTVIPCFGLRYFHLPADARLGSVLLQPFLYRRGLAYPDRRDESPHEPPKAAVAHPRPALPRDIPAALIAAAAGLVLVSAAMWPAFVGMFAAWRNNEAYQYAWLVVPVVVYMLGWHARWGNTVFDARPDFTGFSLVVGAAVCWSAAELMNLDVVRQFALVVALQGIALSTLGWRAYRHRLPVLALLFLMIPAGDILHPLLRRVAASSIELVASVLNLPHVVDGFFILVGTHRYFVAQECSGLAYVTLASFVGYCFGLLLFRSLWKVVALGLLGAALGIASNVVRVNAIVIIDWMRDSQMPLTSHGTIQWITLLGAITGLLYVLNRCAGDEFHGVPALPRKACSWPRKIAPLTAALAGALIAAGASGLRASDMQSPSLMAPGAFPDRMAGWVLVARQSGWSNEPDGLTASVQATYGRNGRELRLVMIRTLAPNGKLAEWKLDPDDRSAWRDKSATEDRGCVDSHCVHVRHAIWQRIDTRDERHVYSAYVSGVFVTDSRVAASVAGAWNSLAREPTNARLIGFISDTALDPDELAEALRNVVTLNAAR